MSMLSIKIPFRLDFKKEQPEGTGEVRFDPINFIIPDHLIDKKRINNYQPNS